MRVCYVQGAAEEWGAERCAHFCQRSRAAARGDPKVATSDIMANGKSAKPFRTSPNQWPINLRWNGIEVSEAGVRRRTSSLECRATQNVIPARCAGGLPYCERREHSMIPNRWNHSMARKEVLKKAFGENGISDYQFSAYLQGNQARHAGLLLQRPASSTWCLRFGVERAADRQSSP